MLSDCRISQSGGCRVPNIKDVRQAALAFLAKARTGGILESMQTNVLSNILSTRVQSKWVTPQVFVPVLG